MSNRSRILESSFVHTVILALLAIVIYSNTFHGPFVFDDEPSISGNPLIQNLANYFTNGSGYADRPNRFIGYLSFALNYHFGALQVEGYHVVNLALHIINSLLVYVLVRLTLRTPAAKGLQGVSSFLPFFTALLFVVHPIQTQAVTYIVQRLTSLATLFFLSALVLHVRWRLASVAGAGLLSVSVLPWWLLSLSCAVLAMKSKEIAFTLPLVVLLYEFAFFGRPSKKLLPPLLPMLMTVGIIPLTLLNVLKPLAEVLSDAKTVTVAQSTLSRSEYLFTQFSVIVTYLRLLVLPVGLNLDYDYRVNHSLFEPRSLLSLLLLLSLMVIGIVLWRKGAMKAGPGDAASTAASRLAAFGIFWFFITLSVESSIVPITDVIFEHRVYLPSVGFFISATALLSAAVAGKHFNRVVPPLLVVVLILSGSTFARNRVWQSEETLWRDVMSKSPAKARPHVNLGTVYGEREQVVEALREFETAARLEPEHPEALSNLVLLNVSAGHLKEAEIACATLLKLDPKLEYRVNLYKILAMPDDGNPALRMVRDACHISAVGQQKVGGL